MLQPTKARVLLASHSPRRKQLLAMIVPDFAVADMHDIDEVYPAELKAEDVPAYLSQLKARAFAHQLNPDEIIITADTVVINDGKIMGKPHSVAEAVEMLKSLMGKTHTVVTGVTLTSIGNSETFSEKTDVTFTTLSDDEITAYVENYMPLDKAGAYGIQEWIGCAAITGVTGCFYNVMGLPMNALYHHIRNFKY